MPVFPFTVVYYKRKRQPVVQGDPDGPAVTFDDCITAEENQKAKTEHDARRAIMERYLHHGYMVKRLELETV